MSIDFFIFGIMPYVALTVLVIGSIARYERDPFTWKSSSSQLLRRKQLMWGSVLFHVGIIVVFFGHLVGLFTPIWVLDAIGISYGFKQLMAIVVGGIAGVAALIGASMLLHRRLSDPRIRKTSSFADIGILSLIWLQLAVGLGTIFLSMKHLDGGEMVRFMTWAQSVMGLQLNAWLEVANVHALFKFHIFLGLLIVILFPFTRLVHMLSVPVRYLWRPGYQVVRSRRQTALSGRRDASASASRHAARSSAGGIAKPAE